ncbi:MAG: hypothetical protein GWP09_02405 [Nitrospiraceae bacterium]|nr:hypothetical protein [Nitrospiraceae bacterium]
MIIQPEWYAGLIGVLAPLIVHLIVIGGTSRRVKSLIALFISALIGFGSAYFSGQFDPATILKSIAAAFTISQIVYDQFFKDVLKKNNKK